MKRTKRVFAGLATAINLLIVQSVAFAQSPSDLEATIDNKFSQIIKLSWKVCLGLGLISAMVVAYHVMTGNREAKTKFMYLAAGLFLLGIVVGIVAYFTGKTVTYQIQ